MSTDSKPTRSFYYPDQIGKPAHRMCADGQRRAADYGVRIHREFQEGGVTSEVTDVMIRAAKSERQRRKGAKVNKRDLIAQRVVEAAIDGSLSEYVTPEGDFLLEAFDGTQIPRNVHNERARGKNFH